MLESQCVLSIFVDSDILVQVGLFDESTFCCKYQEMTGGWGLTALPTFACRPNIVRLLTLWIDAFPVLLRSEAFFIHFFNQFTGDWKDGDDVLVISDAIEEVSNVASP